MKSPELASPPEAFRDPKVAFRDLKEEFREQRNPSGTTHSDVQTAAQISSASNVSFKAQDGTNLQQKGSPLIKRPPIKDHPLDSRLRRQQFTEARSSSVLSAPTLKEEVMEEEEEEQRECSRIIESYSNSAADRKMSRSNTISFGEGEVNSAEQKVAEKLAELRLRRSTLEDRTGEEGSTDPDLMEHKSLPQRQLHHASSVPALVQGFHCCDWVPHKSLVNDERLLSKVAYSHGPATVQFLRDRDQFTRLTSFPGTLYSSLGPPITSRPYFQRDSEPEPKSSHLIVCVHGLDGNSADLRLVKTYLEMGLPSAGLQFLMSEINQMDTFQSFEDMTRKLVNEIMYHVKTSYLNIGKISFIGHSLGCILIRSAIQKPELANFSSKFHTFLSLSGPHIGTMFNNSGLVNAGMWMMQKWKKSGSLQQLALKVGFDQNLPKILSGKYFFQDTTDIRASFIYKLAEKSNLEVFKHLLLASSDHILSYHYG